MANLYNRDVYGPVDPSVLTDQDCHRSELVFLGGDTVMRTRRADGHYFKLVKSVDFIPPHRRVLQKLHQMGFYRFYLSTMYGQLRCDMGLVTALIERWRPETNTFHLRSGEATVTLQDVAILWGVPVDGRAVVIHHVFNGFGDYAALVHRLLGFEIGRNDFKATGMGLKMKKLCEFLKSPEAIITDESPEHIVDQITRCWAFALLGVMLPDSSGEVISILWLKFFENIEEVNSYSWGSGVLAFLYRQLHHGSLRTHKEVCGPMTLLQLWAWSRIMVVRPSTVPHLMAEMDVHNIARAPYGKRWYRPVSNPRTTTHSLLAAREVLDQMTYHHFVWDLYNFNEPDIAELPPECFAPSVWRASVPMVFLNIVEYHRPERVLQQFGFRQGIPRHPSSHPRFDRIVRAGRDNEDWSIYNRIFIDQWNDRLHYVVVGEFGGGTTEDYSSWYDSITRRFISKELDRLTVGFQTGSAPLLYDVNRQIQQLQRVVQEAPDSRQRAEGLLGSVRSGLTQLSRMVSCSRRSDAAAGVHFAQTGREDMRPQRRSSVERDIDDVHDSEDEEELVRRHSRPCAGEPGTSSQVPRTPTFGPSSSTVADHYATGDYFPQMVDPTPEPQLPYTFQDEGPSSSTWATPDNVWDQFIGTHMGLSLDSSNYSPPITRNPPPVSLHFDTSAVPFNFDINRTEEEMQGRRRSTRRGRAPNCGTGGHRGLREHR